MKARGDNLWALLVSFTQKRYVEGQLHQKEEIFLPFIPKD